MQAGTAPAPEPGGWDSRINAEAAPPLALAELVVACSEIGRLASEPDREAEI